MWNICALLFINLKIWGIFITFTYYNEQIRISRNNVQACNDTILKVFEPKPGLYILTQRDPRTQPYFLLSVFVLMLYKRSHTTLLGQVNAIPYIHQSETCADPSVTHGSWSCYNKHTVVCIRLNYKLSVNVKRPHSMTSKVPTSFWWLILNVVRCGSQV